MSRAAAIRTLVERYYPGAKPAVISNCADMLAAYNEVDAERIIREAIAEGYAPTPARITKAIERFEQRMRDEHARTVESEKRRKAKEQFEAHQRLRHRAKQRLDKMTDAELAQIYDDATDTYTMHPLWMEPAWAFGVKAASTKNEIDIKARIVRSQWLLPIVIQTLINQGAVTDWEGAFARTPEEIRAGEEADKLLRHGFDAVNRRGDGPLTDDAISITLGG